MQVPNIKHILIGRPFPTSAQMHERLDRVRGLAVFASDPISSNAYATEAIMSVLIILGSGALSMTMPIALAIGALVLIVVFSYIQTILHYPGGGGAYTVAKDNLGVLPSLIAAGALLTDYILTVSVSVAAGIRAMTSAFPEVYEYRVGLALIAIALIMWANLRGVRESGTIFAFPTYAFVGGVLVVIVIGLVRYFGLFGAPPLVSPAHVVEAVHPVIGFAYIWLLLRAFAAGCTALTGIEAISNGVQAFKAPEAKNAAITMVIMGVMAMSLFAGISFLATHLNLVPEETDSILSQMTRTVTGGGFLYYWVQLFTMLILILAANTAYQDFPRLSYFLSRDGFLPRWMQHLGSRLVYSYGIIVLTVISALLVVVFQADEIRMLPLYALGVMISFTLSQAGMVRLMGKVAKIKPGETLHTEATVIHYEAGWWWKRAVNAVGSVTTFVVFVVLVATKFLEGAWLIALAIPCLIWLFRGIKHHYATVAAALRTRDLTARDVADIGDIVIVPIADIHRGTLRALKYAKRISNNVRAILVVAEGVDKTRVKQRWDRFPEITRNIDLVFIAYEFRDILTPLVEYIEYIHHVEYPGQLTTVVIPEFVPSTNMEHMLHNQTANFLRFRLRAHEDIIVIDVPYHIRAHSHDPLEACDRPLPRLTVEAPAAAPSNGAASHAETRADH